MNEPNVPPGRPSVKPDSEFLRWAFHVFSTLRLDPRTVRPGDKFNFNFDGIPVSIFLAPLAAAILQGESCV